MKFRLETVFTSDDIVEIYKKVIIYSILKYKALSKDIQMKFKSRYEQAVMQLERRHIGSEVFEHTSLEDLKQQLLTVRNVYNNEIEKNREVVDSLALGIKALVLRAIASKESELDRLSYLFDFMSQYLVYPEEMSDCCLKVPPVDGFEFSFKDNVPVDFSLNGMLVMRQGLCNDICDLMIHLGNCLNLKMSKHTCQYKGFLHAINVVTLENGEKSLIDATRLIRGDKTKEECFLVSDDELNKNNEYQFGADLPKTVTYKGTILNFQEEASKLIELINSVSDLSRKSEVSLARKHK